MIWSDCPNSGEEKRFPERESRLLVSSKANGGQGVLKRADGGAGRVII